MALQGAISNTHALAFLNLLDDAVNAGDVGGILNIYTGSLPARCEDAPTGTLLCTLEMNNIAAFGAATDAGDRGEMTSNSITPRAGCFTNGTAGYFRVYSCNTERIDANKIDCIFQGSVGDKYDAPVNLQLRDKNILAGDLIYVTTAAKIQLFERNY